MYIKNRFLQDWDLILYRSSKLEIYNFILVQWQSVYKGQTPKIDQVPGLFTSGRDTRPTKHTQFEDESFLRASGMSHFWGILMIMEFVNTKWILFIPLVHPHSKPKTQTPFYVPPGQAPRKLVIERKRREYMGKRDSERNLGCSHNFWIRYISKDGNQKITG